MYNPGNRPFILLILLAALRASTALAEITPDDQNGCGYQRSMQAMAENACAQYKLRPQYDTVPEIQAAHASCISFFKIAFQANNLLCSYDKDAQAAAASISTSAAAADVGQSNAALGTAASANANAADLHRTYGQAFSHKRVALNESFLAYGKQITAMSRQSWDTFLAERQCRTVKSMPVPAIVEAGLFKRGFDDATKARGILEGALNDGISMMRKAISGEASASATLTTRAADLSDVGSSPTITGTTIISGADQNSEVNAGFHGAVTGVTAMTAAESAVKLGLVASHSSAVGSAAAAVVQLGLSGVVKLPELLSIGTFAFGNVAGVGATLATAAYRDNQSNMKNYANFSAAYVNSHQDATSDEVGRAFAASPQGTCKY